MEEDLKKTLRKITQTDPVYCQVCWVDKVGSLTCDVTEVGSEAPILNVRLKAHLQGDNGIVVKPAKGSFVLVAFLSSTDAYVVMCDELESINVKIGGSTLSMDKDYIKMNGGSLKGLTKLEKLVERMNKMEDEHNKFLTDYKAHNHLHPYGPTTAFVTPCMQQDIDKTKIDDLENKKITHG